MIYNVWVLRTPWEPTQWSAPTTWTLETASICMIVWTALSPHTNCGMQLTVIWINSCEDMWAFCWHSNVNDKRVGRRVAIVQFMYISNGFTTALRTVRRTEQTIINFFIIYITSKINGARQGIEVGTSCLAVCWSHHGSIAALYSHLFIKGFFFLFIEICSYLAVKQILQTK